MCGIVGWVAYDSSPRSGQQVIDAMTATMACRGPDDAGTWLGEQATLGHRRLAVIDPPGGRQPMSVQTPAGEVVLTYSGEVYNFTELRAELETRGHVFGTRSDTEVVLRGYLQWGDSVAERLRGMYAFAIWDDRTGKLVMVRDRLAVKPLYYTETGDGVVFASEPKGIFAHPSTRRRTVGPGGLRELFAGVKTPGHAVWNGMREVRPGTVVTVTSEGAAERVYWRLETREHTDDLPTTIETVRGLLTDVVREQMVADVPLCTLLSGGLDSSAITALAARGAGHDQTVRSFAVDYTGHAEFFDSGVVQKGIDAPYAEEAAAKAGTEHETVLLDSTRLSDPDMRARIIRARDLPIVNGDVDVSLLMLFERIKQDSTVALSGEAADELFGGYLQFHDPATQQARDWWSLTYFRDFHHSDLERLNPQTRAALDLETYWTETHATTLSEIDRLPGESDLEYRMREINHSHITRHAQWLLDRKDRISMAVGLEVRVPYCDHRLVEYVYNTPWAYKTSGREKDLLRSAVADLLPTSVLEREKSGYPATPHPAYRLEIQRQCRDLAARANHPVFDLVSRDWLTTTATTPLEHLLPTARAGMHHALNLAQWIDLYNPAIEVNP